MKIVGRITEELRAHLKDETRHDFSIYATQGRLTVDTIGKPASEALVPEFRGGKDSEVDASEDREQISKINPKKKEDMMDLMDLRQKMNI